MRWVRACGFRVFGPAQLNESFLTLILTYQFLYLSSDSCESDFESCLSTLGCCGIPYEERQVSADILALFQIHCMPNLLMLGPPNERGDRPVINQHVRDLFWQNDEAAALVAAFPFCPRAFGDLNQVSDNINASKCLVLLCEACDDDEQREYMETVKVASKAYGCKTPMKFYWACEPSAVTKTLRDALRLGPPTGPNVVLLDFPSDCSYYVYPFMAEISPQSLLDFIKAPGRVYQLG